MTEMEFIVETISRCSSTRELLGATERLPLYWMEAQLEARERTVALHDESVKLVREVLSALQGMDTPRATARLQELLYVLTGARS